MDTAEEKNGGFDKEWIQKIHEGDRRAFEKLFFEYFYDLCSYALQITKSQQKAKDIVQEVFYKLWKRREEWTIHSSLQAYLFRSVRNEALNKLDREEHCKDVREEFTFRKNNRQTDQSDEDGVDQELLKKIWNVVSEMPNRRQSVFILHRKHGLSYREIAQVLDITRKTVENHMGLALDDIRKQIECEYL